MKKLVYIDACMRAGSRTKRIASPIIAELRKRYSVETVDLTKNIYPIVDNYILDDRNQGIVPAEHMALAKRIEDALAMWEYAKSLPYISKIGLLGHSQGGVVASMTAGILASRGESPAALCSHHFKEITFSVI